jgi:hypothetical protein
MPTQVATGVPRIRGRKIPGRSVAASFSHGADAWRSPSARSAGHPLRFSISKSGSRVIATNPDGAQSGPFHALADIAADPSRETGMIANRI